MTDNRTNEPTPEQVEVAAVASINSHRSRVGLPTLATLDGVPNADEWRDDARAALVAAQEAAPQADQEAVDEEQIVTSVLAELEDHRATGDTGGWGTTFHRHGLSNEIHRGVDDCGRGTGKPVYVFDPDFLEEHDAWVVQATLRAVAAPAPVPSSGVDEDELAQVIYDRLNPSFQQGEKWLETVDGTANRQSWWVARAVVAYLRGES